jgi:hypothetical protein
MKEFSEFEFTQRLYFFELDRKQQLESNISLPTGAIVAAFGVLGYYFTHFKFGGQQYQFMYLVELLFLFTSGLAGILLAVSTYWCFQAAVGSTYEYLPGSETLRTYLVDLKHWYGTFSKRGANHQAGLEFENYLIGAMAHCSQLNWNTNLVRSEELHRTKRFTVLGLVALAFSAFCYYVDFWFDPRQIL